jgi:hypothetical protein
MVAVCEAGSPLGMRDPAPYCFLAEPICMVRPSHNHSFEFLENLHMAKANNGTTAMLLIELGPLRIDQLIRSEL